MSRRVLTLCLAVLGLALFAMTSALAFDDDKANTHEGTVVSITGQKLVMKTKADDTEHTHTVAQDATITCDGKKCELSDLKPGQKIRVTTKKNDREMVTKLEALDKDIEFPSK